ncbi:MAG TPA: DMT family transporter [Chloroflexota bacterium]
MRYYFGLAVGITAISFTASLIRLSEAPALTIASLRMAITVLLLLPALVAFEGRAALALTRRDLLLCLLSGIFLAFHFAFWTVSLGYTSVASSLVFVSVHPVFVALLGWALFRDRPSGWVAAGIAMSWLGSLLIGFHDLQVGGSSLLGDALAIAGAAAMVGYLLIGSAVRARRGFLTYSVLVYAACAVSIAGMAALTGTSLAIPSSRDLAIFVALAVATVGGHTVFNWVLRHLHPSVVAVSFVAEPAGGALLAWAILGEGIGVATAAGGLVMLLGIYLAARGSQKARPS